MMAAVSIGLLFVLCAVLQFFVIWLIKQYKALYKWVNDLSLDLQMHESDYDGLAEFCMNHVRSHE